ncbi:MAG: hypothetical protein JWO28_2253, partial [Hyphomicrobiales bacterium]|nr:hypothetical protein [Hyphomicrobiales bacterium]
MASDELSTAGTRLLQNESTCLCNDSLQSSCDRGVATDSRDLRS